VRRLTCPRCGYDVAQHSLPMHMAGKRCPARQLYNKLVASGKHVANPNAGRVGDISEALRLFGIEHEILPTRTTTSDGKNPHRDLPTLGEHVWTSLEGAGIVDAIFAVLGLLNLTFPEAARRLVEHRDLIPGFETARALGASDAELVKMLEIITYGKDRNGFNVKEWVTFVEARIT
jgi:hypothetical protein